jgi:hypothetical protein
MAIIKDLSEHEASNTQMYSVKGSTLPMYFLLANADDTNPNLYAEGGTLACLVDDVATDWVVSVLPDLAGLVQVVPSPSWGEVGVFKVSIVYTIDVTAKTYGAAIVTVGDNK